MNKERFVSRKERKDFRKARRIKFYVYSLLRSLCFLCDLCVKIKKEMLPIDLIIHLNR